MDALFAANVVPRRQPSLFLGPFPLNQSTYSRERKKKHASVTGVHTCQYIHVRLASKAASTGSHFSKRRQLNGYRIKAYNRERATNAPLHVCLKKQQQIKKETSKWQAPASRKITHETSREKCQARPRNTNNQRGLPQPSQGRDKGTQPVTFRHVYNKIRLVRSMSGTHLNQYRPAAIQTTLSAALPLPPPPPPETRIQQSRGTAERKKPAHHRSAAAKVQTYIHPAGVCRIATEYPTLPFPPLASSRSTTK